MPRSAAASSWMDTMSMSSSKPHDNDPLAPHRGRLLGLAYRMLRSRSDAEDAGAEGDLRFAGPGWPEPVFDAEGLSADAATELADDLSFALLLALDRLSPMERAAFLLH